MALANELFEAAELTGIARAELDAMEERSTSLAQFLPNEYIFSETAEYHVGATDSQDVARYRAFDAEPERGREGARFKKSVSLPAVSQTQNLGEASKIKMRSLGDDAIRDAIIRQTRKAVSAVFNRTNLQRAHVLCTGKAQVNQDNYKLDDDFGRNPALTTQAPALWSDPSVNRLDHLLTWAEVYTDTSGEEPGAIVLTKRVLSALVRGDEFAIELSNGSTRRGNQAEALGMLEAAGLPPVYVIDSRVGGQSLLPQNGLLLLPAPVGNDSPEATELGATVWGLTATALADGFGIEDSELPGIVAGVDAPNRVPYIHEVFADSINLPVLKQPDLSMFVQVL